jgi:hypothetical protein
LNIYITPIPAIIIGEIVEIKIIISGFKFKKVRLFIRDTLTNKIKNKNDSNVPRRRLKIIQNDLRASFH